MSDLDPPLHLVRAVVARAIAEDLGQLGDLTTSAVVDADLRGEGRVVARAEGTLAGTLAAGEAFRALDPDTSVTWLERDGHELARGAVVGRVEGRLAALLGAERTALNLLCHLSGVATLTRRYVRAAHGRTRVLDTRKTLPGLRALQKAAVRAGGGMNHRESLSDAVMLKDNHLAGLDVARAVDRARVRWPGRAVIVECDDLDALAAAAAAAPDRILLDNMTPAQVADAVARLGGTVPVEVSGGVTIETIAAYADAGADYVSVGALTHSAPALDLALDLD